MSFKRIKVSMVSLVLILSVVITGCSKNISETENVNSAEEKKDTITIVINKDITTLDPQYCMDLTAMGVEFNIYDSLIFLKDNGEIKPGLAESWDISEDGLTYTFHLKKGVKFHNGESFTAKDVKYTFDRAMQSSYSQNNVSMVESLDIVDDYTVAIKLKYSYAPFIRNLGAFVMFIVNEKAVKEAGENYGHNPVGTGPYKFVNWVSGDKIELERFDEYHNGPAPIKNTVFRIISDPSTALVALENKEVDVVVGIAPIDRKTVEDNPDLKLYECASAGYDYIGFNCEKKPFDNKLVRQAISYAIDKNEMLQVAKEGVGLVTDTVTTDGIFGHSKDVKGSTYDPTKAKELLSQAGYPNGFETSIITFESHRTKIAEVLQAKLTEIGIDAKIDILEFGTMLKKLEDGDDDIFILGWTDDVADADYSLYQQFHSTQAAANLNHYKNPQLDGLMESARQVYDEQQRLDLYKQCLEIVNEDVPQIPLYFAISNIACNKDIKGAYTWPTNVCYVYDFSW